VDELIATLATHSWALVAEPAERDAALARARAYLAERPETKAGEFELPLVTDVLRARRIVEPVATVEGSAPRRGGDGPR
jgi:hypothetical protein